MPDLLARIPFRYWLYGGLLAILAIMGIHEYQEIEAKGAAREAAAVQAASAKADAAAKAAIAKLTADYSAALVTVGEIYAKAMQSADAAHSADLKRLQQRAAGSGAPNTAVGDSTSAASAADAGAISARALGSVPAERALDLADALRVDDAALTQCYADRDSLTGK